MALSLDELVKKLATNRLTRAEVDEILKLPEYAAAISKARSNLNKPEIFDKVISHGLERGDFRGIFTNISAGLPDETRNKLQTAILSADFAGETAEQIIKKAKEQVVAASFPVKVEVDDIAKNKLVTAYKAAYRDLQLQLETSTDFSASRRRALMTDLKQKLNALGVQTDEWIKQNLPDSYAQGANDALHQLNFIGAGQKVGYTFNRVHQDMVSVLVSDTQKSFGDALTAFYKSTQNLLDQATKDEIKARLAGNIIKGEDRRQIKKDIISAFYEKGISSLTDKSGKSWELDHYADMLVRTKIVEARNTGMQNKMIENGYDLVQVSSHGADDVCGDWEGKVLSMTGKTPGYPTVADATAAGLFHPNCRHAINVIVPELQQKIRAYETVETDQKKTFKENKPAEPVTKWQAAMTEDQAKEFTKDSVIQEEVYHGTSVKNAESLKKEGFNVSRSDPLSTFGPGAYFTNEYGKAEYHSPVDGTVLPARLNVNRMKTFTFKDFEEEVLFYNRLTGDYETAVQAFTNTLSSKYDAIEIVDGRGFSTYLVYRPESIVLIDKK